MRAISRLARFQAYAAYEIDLPSLAFARAVAHRSIEGALLTRPRRLMRRGLPVTAERRHLRQEQPLLRQEQPLRQRQIDCSSC